MTVEANPALVLTGQSTDGKPGVGVATPNLFFERDTAYLWYAVGGSDSTYYRVKTASESITVPAYGGMYVYDKAVALGIDTANAYHPLHLVTAGDITAGNLLGWTFAAGRTVDSNITSEASASGLLRIVTSSTHGLLTGDIVTITNANNAGHNGKTRITKINTTTFDCDDIAYVANAGTSAAVVDEPAYLLAGSSAAGVYIASFSVSGTPTTGAKVYKFEITQNISGQDNIVTEAEYASASLTSTGAAGTVNISAGDRIWLALKNLTDTTDFTVKHANVALHRI